MRKNGIIMAENNFDRNSDIPRRISCTCTRGPNKIMWLGSVVPQPEMVAQGRDETLRCLKEGLSDIMAEIRSHKEHMTHACLFISLLWSGVLVECSLTSTLEVFFPGHALRL